MKWFRANKITNSNNLYLEKKQKGLLTKQHTTVVVSSTVIRDVVRENLDGEPRYHTMPDVQGRRAHELTTDDVAMFSSNTENEHANPTSTTRETRIIVLSASFEKTKLCEIHKTTT